VRIHFPAKVYSEGTGGRIGVFAAKAMMTRRATTQIGKGSFSTVSPHSRDHCYTSTGASIGNNRSKRATATARLRPERPILSAQAKGLGKLSLNAAQLQKAAAKEKPVSLAAASGSSFPSGRTKASGWRCRQLS
jgi:hypothetical protein